MRAAFGEKLDSLDGKQQTSHILRIQNLQRIFYKVMADNNLDALVYLYQLDSLANYCAQPDTGGLQHQHRAARTQGRNEAVRSELFCPAKRR